MTAHALSESESFSDGSRLDDRMQGRGNVLPSAVFSVAGELRSLTQDQRERVLLAVAVLYGIIRPDAPPRVGEGGHG